MYLLIENFNAGLDTRRMFLTAKAGSLQKLKNAHITRGGEIEKRLAFSHYTNLPTNTFGLQAAGNSIYVFGSVAKPFGFPASLSYQQLVHPTGVAMSELLYSETFNGKIYAVAKYTDGSIYHFYDGSRVTSWDTLSASAASNSAVATNLAAQIDATIPFIATAVGSTITITNVTTDQPFTASATVSGSSQTITFATAQAPSTGVAQISTATIGGTFSANTVFSIRIKISAISFDQTFSIQATAAGAATVVRTFGSKLYSIAGSNLFFSNINDPTAYTYLTAPSGTNNGSGTINLSNQDNGFETLTAMGVYQGKLAVFGRRTVQTWTMDPDPTKNAASQTLKNIGTFAPRSVTAFGDIDVFFLSDTGVRSLRARDASNAATVSDVGTNIDTLIQSDLATLPDTTKAAAFGIIEPVDGRFWLAVGQKIYVYSFFPSANIAAWSTYEPGFAISSFAYSSGKIYARSGDAVYLYGGLTGNEYDNSQVEVVLPFIDGGKPAHMKSFTGFDMACTGTWDVFAGLDTTVPDVRDHLGTVSNSTYGFANLLANGIGTHIGVRLVTSPTYSGPAKLGNFAAHFEINDAG